jgi:hypothetical protein
VRLNPEPEGHRVDNSEMNRELEEVLAKSAHETLSRMAGRWTRRGDCAGDWIEFLPTGSGWSYRDGRWNQGAPTPANVSVNKAAGEVIVQINTAGEDVYQYANKSPGEDSLEAVEGFTSGPFQGRSMFRVYSRCK